MADIPATRASLLVRLRDPQDDAAWAEFVALYAPLLYGFARKQGLQDADAVDVSQEVVSAVAASVGRLEYDPARGAFRNWLLTVVRRKLANWRRAQRHGPRGSGDTDTHRLLEQCPASAGDEAEWDAAWERQVFAWACEQVRARVSEATWQAFWRTAIDGRGGQAQPGAQRRFVRGPGRPWWPAALGFVTILGLGIVWLVAGGGGPGPAAVDAHEYYHSFKDNPEARQGWELIGPDAEQAVKFEPAGLRITLPGGPPTDHPGTGVACNLPVKGDFEITVGFEVLQESEAADAVKVSRLSLVVNLDRPNWNMAALSRSLTKERPACFMWLTLWNEAEGRNQSRFHTFPDQGKAGWLRLARRGSMLSCAVAEDAAGEFTRLQQDPFRADDLKDVRLTAISGGPRAALDVRVIDCRIRAESLSGVPAAQRAVVGPKHWSLVALAGGTAITSLLVGWFYGRRRRLAGTGPAAAVSFPCPGCGKPLKAKAALAGKKVKCPQCGRPVLVPPTAPC
jgi:RNA polymerase sigma-70 factor (ECF subfamily)